MTKEQETINSINSIIHNYTREITNFEEKLAISTAILLLIDSNSIAFSEFLYSDKELYKILEDFYSEEFTNYGIDVDFFKTRNAYDSVFKNLKEQLIKKIDVDKYYKALFEKDEYALAISEIAGIIKNSQALNK